MTGTPKYELTQPMTLQSLLIRIVLVIDSVTRGITCPLIPHIIGSPPSRVNHLPESVMTPYNGSQSFSIKSMYLWAHSFSIT